MSNLTAALIKARSTFSPIVKNKINPQFKSKYANLDSILDSIVPALSSAGLVIIQPTIIRDGVTILITKVLHESGESIESELALPNCPDPQKLGSALTYYRRFSLCSLLSIAADDDDDGNTATSSYNDRKAANSVAAKIVPKPIALASTLEPRKIDLSGDLQSVITQYQADLKTAFDNLGWDNTRKSGWAKTINPSPFTQWRVEDYKLALHRAYAEIDKLDDTMEVIAVE